MRLVFQIQSERAVSQCFPIKHIREFLAPMSLIFSKLVRWNLTIYCNLFVETVAMESTSLFQDCDLYEQRVVFLLGLGQDFCSQGEHNADCCASSATVNSM